MYPIELHQAQTITSYFFFSFLNTTHQLKRWKKSYTYTYTKELGHFLDDNLWVLMKFFIGDKKDVGIVSSFPVSEDMTKIWTVHRWGIKQRHEYNSTIHCKGIKSNHHMKFNKY